MWSLFFAAGVEGRGSRVEGRGSRVEDRGFNVEGEGSRSRIEVACKQAFPCGFGAKNQLKNKERESETARKMEQYRLKLF